MAAAAFERVPVDEPTPPGTFRSSDRSGAGEIVSSRGSRSPLVASATESGPPGSPGGRSAGSLDARTGSVERVLRPDEFKKGPVSFFTRARRFAAPGAVLLLSLVLQTFGRYAATCYYVAAMEAMHDASADHAHHHRGRRLDGPTLAPYDCVTGLERWADLWSPARKDYCCSKWKHKGSWPHGAKGAEDACSEAEWKKSTTDHKPRTLEHDCGKGLHNWEDKWPASKKTFCCKQWQNLGILPAKGGIPKGASASIGHASRACCVVLNKDDAQCAGAEDEHGKERDGAKGGKARESSHGHKHPKDDKSPEKGTGPAVPVPAPSPHPEPAPAPAPAPAPRAPPPAPAVPRAVFRVGALQDDVLALLSWPGLPVQPLEFVPVAMLALLLVLSFVLDDLSLWMKCCVCTATIAVLQGLLVWATIIPNAEGWSGCRARLGEEGLQHFRAAGGLSDIKSFLDVLALEILGIWSNRVGFCADTVLSGHMCTSVIFSLGLYELCWTSTRKMSFAAQVGFRVSLAVVLTSLVGCGLVFDLVSRLHYSMDVVLAFALAQLLYSSYALAVAVKSWAALLEGESGRNPGLQSDPEVGALLEPCLCVPLCCFPAARARPEEQQGQRDQEEELRKRLGELQRQLDEERGVRRFADERRVEEEKMRTEAEASLRTARLHLEQSVEKHLRSLEEVKEQHGKALEEVRRSDSRLSDAAEELQLGTLERRVEEQSRRAHEAEEARALAESRANVIADALAKALNSVNQTDSAHILPAWMQGLGGPSGVSASEAAAAALAAGGGEARERATSKTTAVSNTPSDLPLIPPGAQVIDV